MGKKVGFIEIPTIMASLIFSSLFSFGAVTISHISNSIQVDKPLTQAVKETPLPIPKPQQSTAPSLEPSASPQIPPTYATPPVAAPVASPVASDSATLEMQIGSVREIINPVTFTISIDGKIETVRLIGLREFIAPCQLTPSLETGQVVYLISDPMQSDRDPGGNLYRYLFLENETLLNQKLIADGLAQTYNFLSSPYLYESEFTKLQTQAQEKKLGMWNRVSCSEKLEIESSTVTSPTPTSITSPNLTSLLDQEVTKDEAQKIFEKISKNIAELKRNPPTPASRIRRASPLFKLTSQASQPATAGASLNSEIIFNLLNEHRASLNMAPFSKDERICSVATSRGPELFDEIFVTHTMHAGFYALNLPYWATENVAHFGSESIIVNWWLNSPVHRSAIEGNYTHSCGACLGNSCSQIFTSFVAK